MISTFSKLFNPAKTLIRQTATQSRLFSAEISATQATAVTTPPPGTPADEPDKLYSKLEVELKGCDPAVLKSYTWFATTAAQHLGIECGKSWALRKAHHNRFVLLKSVHIYKKHRVQYEIRTYYRFMHFHRLTGSTLDTFLEYIERNLPEGCALKATKIELQQLPEHLKQPPATV